MQVNLKSHDDRHLFEERITRLIENGHLLRAESLTSEAIKNAGSQELQKCTSITLDKLSIEGWAELSADLIEADEQLQKQYGYPSSAVFILLVNQGIHESLSIRRTFCVNVKKLRAGLIVPSIETEKISPVSEKTIHVCGLEPIMAIQRTRTSFSTTDAEREVADIDKFLSGLLLVIKYHQLVCGKLDDLGLPRAVTCIIGIHRSSGPEAMYDMDLGPETQYVLKSKISEHQISAASEICAIRKEKQKADYQEETAQSVAEMRERYRILRFFPFYRFASRNKLAVVFDGFVAAMRHGQHLPNGPKSWRMKKKQLEKLLRQYVEAKQVVDVEYTLDVQHVNKLHDRWVATAQRQDFHLDQNCLSLFEVELAWALKVGGPIFRDRWENATNYEADD